MKEISATLDVSSNVRKIVREETGVGASSGHSKPDRRPQIHQTTQTLKSEPHFKPSEGWENLFAKGAREVIKVGEIQGDDVEVERVDLDVGEIIE